MAVQWLRLYRCGDFTWSTYACVIFLHVPKIMDAKIICDPTLAVGE